MQSNFMGTTHFSGPVDSAEGFSVDGTIVIDGDGNIDAPVTTVSPLTLTKTDDGAVGAIFDGVQISTTPAADDKVALYRGTGRDSAANAQIYGQMSIDIDVATSDSEAGFILFEVAQGDGTLAEVGAFLHDGTNPTLEVGDSTNKAIITNPDEGIDVTTGAATDIALIPGTTGKVDVAKPVLFSSTETIAAGGTSTALSLATSESFVDSDAGGDVFTLADGVNGQQKLVVQASATGISTVTPANFTGGTSVTMATAGATATFQFSTAASGWVLIGENAATVI